MVLLHQILFCCSRLWWGVLLVVLLVLLQQEVRHDLVLADLLLQEVEEGFPVVPLFDTSLLEVDNQEALEVRLVLEPLEVQSVHLREVRMAHSPYLLDLHRPVQEVEVGQRGQGSLEQVPYGGPF